MSTPQDYVSIPASGVAPSGSAGGDLSGTYPNPAVEALTVTAGSMAIGAVTDGQTLIRSGSTIVGKTGAAAITTTTGPTDLVLGAVADGQALQRIGSTAVGRCRTWQDKAFDDLAALLTLTDGSPKFFGENFFDLSRWTTTDSGTGAHALDKASKSGGLQLSSGAVTLGASAAQLGGADQENSNGAVISSASVDKWACKVRFVVDTAVDAASNAWFGMKDQASSAYIYPGVTGSQSTTLFTMNADGNFTNSTVSVDTSVHELTIYNNSGTTTAKFKFDSETAISFTVTAGALGWFPRFAVGNGASNATRTGRILNYAILSAPLGT